MGRTHYILSQISLTGGDWVWIAAAVIATAVAVTARTILGKAHRIAYMAAVFVALLEHATPSVYALMGYGVLYVVVVTSFRRRRVTA